MNWLALIQALVPVGVQIAQQMHPQRGVGPTRAATVLAMVQPILTIAAATGAIPASQATDTALVMDQITQEVARQKATGVLPH